MVSWLKSLRSNLPGCSTSQEIATALPGLAMTAVGSKEYLSPPPVIARRRISADAAISPVEAPTREIATLVTLARDDS
jgi:hypothetical protein